MIVDAGTGLRNQQIRRKFKTPSKTVVGKPLRVSHTDGSIYFRLSGVAVLNRVTVRRISRLTTSKDRS